MQSDAGVPVYPYTIRYNNKTYALLWQPRKDGDCFLTSNDGSLYEVIEFGESGDVDLTIYSNIIWQESAHMDFDVFWAIIAKLDNLYDDANEDGSYAIILNGWNCMEDILRTFSLGKVRERLNSELLDKAYKKIYYGCNMQPVTPPGKAYSPIWEDSELTELRSALLSAWQEIVKLPKLWEYQEGSSG